MARNEQTNSKGSTHTCGGPAFGRLTPGCPRCDELSAGATPRTQPWRTRPSEDATRTAEIRSHSCERSGCGRVCTFGDW